MALNIHFRGNNRIVAFTAETRIGDLLEEIELETGITRDYLKLIAPGIGLLKGSSLNEQDKIEDVFKTEASRSKITLVGTPAAQIQKLNDAENAKAVEHQRRAQRYQYQRIHQKRATTTVDSAEDSQYTFGKLVPLPMLPNADKSLAILQKLKDDRGVQQVMKKYKMRVGVLTELDPASNSTRESRILGLNENMGQVIRLRIRTDDYGGWCNYREIRKVLCHELTHNYHGDHDRKFWDMCNKLEKEVISLDPFGSTGHQTGDDIYHGPGHNEEMLYDDGGWFGTTQILGGDSVQKNSAESARDRMLRASQERLSRQQSQSPGQPQQPEKQPERETPPPA